jgi:hypothetical protein
MIMGSATVMTVFFCATGVAVALDLDGMINK